MAVSYTVGDLVRVQGTLSDAAGVAIDPTSLLIKVRDPSGVVATLTYPADITQSATGVYIADINIDDDGCWRYRFESSGTGQAAQEGFFIVEKSRF